METVTMSLAEYEANIRERERLRILEDVFMSNQFGYDSDKVKTACAVLGIMKEEPKND